LPNISNDKVAKAPPINFRGILSFTITAHSARLLRLELELRSPFGGLAANEKSVERLALLAGEALEECGFSFGA
jgi:hypothetical protein